METKDKLTILGVNVDKVDMKEALAVFSDFLETPQCELIFTPNPEIIYAAQSDNELLNLLNKSSLSIPDGMAIIKASKILGSPLKERVTGIDFAFEALKLCEEKGKTVFFLGAKPGVAKMASEELKKILPGLKVVGVRDGYFKDEDEVVSAIRSAKPDLLLTALGAPKQEKFLYEHRDELGAMVAIGLGGSFDVWSGNTKRAPEFFQKNNIEWLYRLFKEPQRLGRMSKIPLFLAMVRRESLK